MAGCTGRTRSTTAARRISLATAVIAAFGVLAPAANAGVLVSSAGSCAAQPLERPFQRWLDPADYTLLPGGSFEGDALAWRARGWRLSGARVVAGNEPFYVHGPGEARSLSLPAGASATSPTICVGLFHPTMRFFARGSGGGLLGSLSTLRVDVLFEDAGGTVRSLPIGVVPRTGQWAPSLPAPVLANLLTLLPGEMTPVAFRFTATGTAGWTIDDVYVDPKRRS
jgi:hypothetical protein